MIELFPGKHLFIDDYRIERTEAIRRVLNPPVKHPVPVLPSECPWERNAVALGRCYYDEARGLFRLWYGATDDRQIGSRVFSPDNPPLPVYGTHVCYAESANGITWERPALGLAEFDGSQDNNIIEIPSLPGAVSPGVVFDPTEEEPDKRFKMHLMQPITAADLSPEQVRSCAYSADGIRWNPSGLQVTPNERLFGVMRFVEERPHGGFNPDARYILYGQRGSPWATRQIGRRDSEDFIHWSENRPVIESSLADPLGMELYWMDGPIVNQTYAGLHLGLLNVYYTDLAEAYRPTRNEGVIDTLLAYGRDSVRWDRWDHVFIGRGPARSFDAGMVLAQYPVIRGDRLYFFYAAFAGTHDSNSTPTIGLATMRLDGFVSVETEHFMPGTLITRPQRWNFDRLTLNTEANQGEVRVQLQDETDKAMDGFSLADCDPIRGDGTSLAVTWQGSDQVGALKGRMITLQFRITYGAKLYSYTLS